VHIHLPDGQPLRQTSARKLDGDAIRFTADDLKSVQRLTVEAI
jgi:hypothetical protein